MMFDYFDTDHSGALDPEVYFVQMKELGKLIEMIMGAQATEEEKLDLLAEVDQDGNGNIEYEEFQSLFRRYPGRKFQKTYEDQF